MYSKDDADMTREFVMLPEFDKRWKGKGFTDDDLKSLQEELTINPEKGDLIYRWAEKNPGCV